MNRLCWLLILTAGLVTAGRFFVPGHGLSLAGSYEALAHIWAGAALLVCCSPRFRPCERLLAGGLLAAASAVEVVMFLLR